MALAGQSVTDRELKKIQQLENIFKRKEKDELRKQRLKEKRKNKLLMKQENCANINPETLVSKASSIHSSDYKHATPAKANKELKESMSLKDLLGDID